MSCAFAKGAAKAKYRRCFGVTELTRLFPKDSRLVRNLNNKAVTEEPSATRLALGITCFDKAVLSSAIQQYLLPNIEAAAVLTGDRKHIMTFNGRGSTRMQSR